MGKIIATMNMTLDGYCDHTSMIADEEIHRHYTELIQNAEALLYGRITYQLMEDFWPALVENPCGDTSMDEFAVAIDDVRKIVFSRTLDGVTWRNSELRKEIVRDELLEMKRHADRDIFVGSPSAIIAISNLGLVDQYQIGLQPTIAGKGLALFGNINKRVDLQLTGTKTFACGALVLYYQTCKS
ncbi:MAG: dihydrofolate reductase family protein [Pyrinomonadaceae bacterium]